MAMTPVPAAVNLRAGPIRSVARARPIRVTLTIIRSASRDTVLSRTRAATDMKEEVQLACIGRYSAGK